MIPAVAVGIVALLVIAWLCGRMSRQHRVTAFHLQTLAGMCERLEQRNERTHPAYLFAGQRIGDAKREGIWE